MKIAIITRHFISNYGSLLQTFATQEIVKLLGHDCVVINYIRKDEELFRREYTLLQNKKKWQNNIIKKIFYILLRQPESLFAGYKFKYWQKKYLKLSKKYNKISDLEKNFEDIDIFVTGSDQVWGPTSSGKYDEAYFLEFTTKKKISYASSFGHSNFSREQENYFLKFLSKYNHVSVREDTAVEFLNGHNINSIQVLDPTLLFDTNFWSNLINKEIKKDYILIYQLHNDKKLFEYAKKVSKKLKLPIIRINPMLHQIYMGGKFVLCPSISKFLSYIKNAKLVITDSFHGTVFSIIFNTQFIEFIPNNNTETRNISILKLTGLTDRIITNDNENVIYNEIIDFTDCNKVLEKERKKSICILEKMINE